MTLDIHLRDATAADLPIFFDHQLDPVANRMAAFTAKDPTDRDAFMAKWTNILADETITIKTILVHGHVIGSVSIYTDAEDGTPQVTYWLGDDHWGKGIATAALAELLRQVTVRPLYARVAKDNLASRRVLEKCGFTVYGEEMGYANARGEEIAELLLELR